jgi:hypothetical protein
MPDRQRPATVRAGGASSHARYCMLLAPPPGPAHSVELRLTKGLCAGAGHAHAQPHAQPHAQQTQQQTQLPLPPPLRAGGFLSPQEVADIFDADDDFLMSVRSLMRVSRDALFALYVFCADARTRPGVFVCAGFDGVAGGCG